MARRNVWRNTARTVRFFVFDAKAGVPFFIFLAHIAIWTLAISVGSFLIFGVMERYGYSLVVAMRLMRTKIAGRVRFAVAWWDRPQRRDFYRS